MACQCFQNLNGSKIKQYNYLRTRLGCFLKRLYIDKLCLNEAFSDIRRSSKWYLFIFMFNIYLTHSLCFDFLTC